MVHNTIKATTEAEAKSLVLAAFNILNTYFHDHCCFTIQEQLNLHGSGERAAKALLNEFIYPTSQILDELGGLVTSVFPVTETISSSNATTGPYAEYGLIIQSPISTYGLCPHHFLPILYKVTYAYLTGSGSRVIGLSKLSRIAELLVKRPVVQEQYTKDLVTVLQDRVIAGIIQLGIDPSKAVRVEGVMAVTSGEHMCVKCRGVRSDSDTTVDFFSGAFVGNTALQQRIWDVHARSGFYASK